MEIGFGCCALESIRELLPAGTHRPDTSQAAKHRSGDRIRQEQASFRDQEGMWSGGIFRGELANKQCAVRAIPCKERGRKSPPGRRSSSWSRPWLIALAGIAGRHGEGLEIEGRAVGSRPGRWSNLAFCDTRGERRLPSGGAKISVHRISAGAGASIALTSTLRFTIPFFLCFFCGLWCSPSVSRS